MRQILSYFLQASFAPTKSVAHVMGSKIISIGTRGSGAKERRLHHLALRFRPYPPRSCAKESGAIGCKLFFHKEKQQNTGGSAHETV
jgi:hypothetical protein